MLQMKETKINQEHTFKDSHRNGQISIFSRNNVHFVLRSPYYIEEFSIQDN